jgi:hypothetical protein
MNNMQIQYTHSVFSISFSSNSRFSILIQAWEGRGAWEGRELTLGRGGRRGGVPVVDELDGGGESTTSRTGGTQVRDEQGRTRGGAGED